MVGAQVSTPVKIFALVAIVAGVALAGGMMFLGPSAAEGGSTASNGVQLDALGRVISAPKAARAVAAKANARIAAPTTASKSAAAVSKASPKHAATSQPRTAVAENGLPRAIADALLRHPSVVVALYTPKGKIDPIGFAEARQGAALARAGFVAVNVFDSRAAAPLMTKLGLVLRAPSVLVFRRSGDLAMRIDGFADRDTVAQAALNAAS